jgi:uncharacterized repeat protein (TIGR01451 family)
MGDALTRFSDPGRPRRWKRRSARVVTLLGAVLLVDGLAATLPAPAALAAVSPTTTTITAIMPGTPLAGHQFRVDVLVTAITNGTPTGSVTVSDGLGAVCTAPLAGGIGSCDLRERTGGAYTLTASYGGVPGTFTGSVSTRTAVTVDARPGFVTSSPPLTAIAGFVYSYGFTASGTPTPTYALAQGAPKWLTIDSATGALSGKVPHGITSFRYTVIAANSLGGTSAGPFDVRVPASPPARTALSARLSCPAQAGLHKTAACTLTVRNDGPAPAGHVVAVITLPQGLAKVSCSSGCYGRDHVVAWNDGTLGSSGSATSTVTFAAGQLGVATVRAAANSADWNPVPQSSQTSATIDVVPGG